MINYRKLNFPKKFLKPGLSDDSFNFTSSYEIYPFSQILCDELLEFLREFPLEPNFAVFFSNRDKTSSVESRLIHTDITRINGKWKKMIFGIHYELEDTCSEFCWWDVGNSKECYPDDQDSRKFFKFQKLNGIHYENRGQLGKNNDTILLESTKIIGPTLVRTDVPHSVIYDNPNRNRVAVSLRFKENFKDWSEVLDFFKIYIL